MINKVKILVVDDEPLVRLGTKHILESSDYHVLQAESGEEAIAKAKLYNPEIILLDVVMPGLNGFDVCRQIKADPELKNSYVLLVSGKKVESEDKIKGLESGADGYITRPFVKKEFLSRLNSLIRIQQTQKELKESKEWLQAAIENINEAVIATDKFGHIVFMNPMAEKTTRWSFQEAAGRPSSEILRIRNDETGEPNEDPVKKVINEGVVIGLANHTILFRRDGSTCFISDSAAPTRDKNGNITGAIIVFQDVTELREKELSVVQAREEWENIFQAIGHPTLILDPNHKIIRANQSVLDLTQKSMEELKELKCHDVFHNNNKPAPHCPMQTMKLSGSLEKQDMEMEALGRTFIVSCTPVFQSDGELKHVIHIATDITKRKEAQQQIKSELKEKEILLQEVHHRVKNNMQIIASLFKLQLNHESKQDVDKILKENMGRVYAMASIHESLYQSERLSEISFDSYLRKLSLMLLNTFSKAPEAIKFQIETPGLSLGIDKANPLALVLNELISNSIKYAFPEQQKGTISIISSIKNDLVELLIEDNGIGMPDSFDWENPNTLGLKLVKSIVEGQLEGSVSFTCTKGTQFRITFNL